MSSLLLLPLLASCGLPTPFSGPDTSLGQPTPAATEPGAVVADEPQAAIVARNILNQGGNAADAAAAAGFAMAVTLPSRAGIGGGGACLIKMPDASGNPTPAVMLLFPPGAPLSAAGGRPAAVPNLPRGLFALQARYGVLPSADVIIPAERLAATGTVSPALAADLQVVGSALLSDPAAAAVFGPQGSLLPAGAPLPQPDLAATLEVLRIQGVQGFYAGKFPAQFSTAANQAGAAILPADFSAITPSLETPVLTQTTTGQAATLPPPDPISPTPPATAGFAVVDKNGGTVTCATSMDNLFGTGRIAAGTGVLLAASPRTTPVPVLAASITTSPAGRVVSVTTGTGTGAISRGNRITCNGDATSCTATADPAGLGLGLAGK
jgi:gamma-glutamyltranspeptidase/glutathione hydrolase